MTQPAIKTLFDSVCEGNSQQVKALLQAGANASATDAATGRSCLHESVLRGYSGITGLLLAADADVNARDREGKTALYHATKGSDRPAMVNELLEAGADPNIPAHDKQGRPCDTPLHHLCEQSNMLLIGRLLEAGADPLQKDESTGKTAFDAILSICKGVQRQVKIYVDLPRIDLTTAFSKADLLREDEHGQSPLHNPLTWRVLPAINAALESQRESPIGKAELFLPASDGLSPMARLGDTALFSVLTQNLQAQHERLNVADFNTTPETAALLAKSNVLESIFSMANARLGTPSDIEKDLRDLPEALHGNVGNYHVLRAGLRQEQNQREHSGHGRRIAI